MKITKIDGAFAEVASGRLSRRINIEMLPGVRPGDYVLVHAGFAIEKVDPKKAEETLRLTQPLLIAQKEYKSGGAG